MSYGAEVEGPQFAKYIWMEYTNLIPSYLLLKLEIMYGKLD